jgi:hypothetical protein
MDSSSKKLINWHFNVLPPETKEALDFLSKQDWLGDFYLAGGTALALQVGNRRSVDLDFFTSRKDFDERQLLINFIDNINWETDITEKNTVYGNLFNSKISFIAYPFFIPKQDYISYGSIKILQPLDIAVMKIIAISQRGKKRDFFDLYWCAQNIETLKSLIIRLKEQYPSVAHDYNHILKSLVYFEDAENDPEPLIYFKISWKEVKNFFNKEVSKIATELLKLND